MGRLGYKLRFSIRDMLWVMVLAAIGVCWWLDRQAITATNRMWKRRASAAADVLIGRGWKVKWGATESVYELPGAATFRYPNTVDGIWNPPPAEDATIE